MLRQNKILTEEEKEKIAKAKKELRAYRDSIAYIKQKQNDNEELRNIIESIRSGGLITGLPAPKGDNPDSATLEESLDKIDRLKIECIEKLKEAIVAKIEVETKIEQLEQPYKSILYLKYISGFKLYRVSEELNYNYRHLMRLHQNALLNYTNL